MVRATFSHTTPVDPCSLWRFSRMNPDSDFKRSPRRREVISPRGSRTFRSPEPFVADSPLEEGVSSEIGS
jgi:hypothetical protein